LRNTLDANPLVGSQGANFYRPRPALPGANLYISGNVTRGAYFRGVRGTRDFRQTALDLPSSSLDTFRSGSLGLDDIVGGAGYAPQPYFSPMSTSLTVRDIQLGRNMPGTSMPRSTNVVPGAEDRRLRYQPTYSSVTDSRLLPAGADDLRLTLPEQSSVYRTKTSDPRLRFSVPRVGEMVSPGGTPTGTLTTNLEAYAGLIPRAGALGMTTVNQQNRMEREQEARSRGFTPAQPVAQDLEYRDPNDRRISLGPDRPILDHRIKLGADPLAKAPSLSPGQAEVAPPQAVAVESSLGLRPPGDRLDQRMSLTPVETIGLRPFKMAGAQEEEPPVGLADLVAGTRAQQQQSVRTTRELARAYARPPQDSWEARLETSAGQDTYADLQAAYNYLLEQDPTALARLQQENLRDALAEPAPAAQTDRLDILTQDIAGRRSMDDAVRARAEREVRTREAATLAHEMLSRPLATFVGDSDTIINQRIGEAEQLLKQGEYYRAANRYEVAHAADESNPLPMIGRGHALIAAGDYLLAVHWLSRGFESFPAIAAFRLDLPRLIGDADLLDRRRADLENIIEINDQYQFRFLLGYIEYYSGLGEIGLEDLRLAAEDAPPDSLIARFPTLLEGKE
jgi:hypothetical protein